jgi:hypothetical protein
MPVRGASGRSARRGGGGALRLLVAGFATVEAQLTTATGVPIAVPSAEVRRLVTSILRTGLSDDG